MPELDYSVYFYTYSTIAQTLAGAFGFLVAVILYMLQGINAHISNCATTLVANSPADRNRLRRLHSSGRWDEMIRLHVESGERNPELTLEMNKNMAEQFYEMQHGRGNSGRDRRDAADRLLSGRDVDRRDALADDHLHGGDVLHPGLSEADGRHLPGVGRNCVMAGDCEVRLDET
jgi:hypothetical protein